MNYVWTKAVKSIKANNLSTLLGHFQMGDQLLSNKL